jgi:TonB family protein
MGITLSLAISLGLHLTWIAASGGSFVQQPNFAVEEGFTRIEIQYRLIETQISRQESAASQEDLQIPLKKEETKEIEPEPSQGSSGAEVESKPDYLKNPAPVYPKGSLRLRQEGLVVLAVQVSRQGHPIQIEIKKSSGYPLLDQAALKALKAWVFMPARIGSLQITSLVEVPIWFKLEHAVRK